VLAEETEWEAAELRAAIQQAIRTRLNPLFKVHDVVITQALPRTASNKVMRRSLRAEYETRWSEGKMEA
jgi:acetyl-CoA synthetase